MKAQKSLSSISASRDLWVAQYRRELAERDHFSGLEAARRKGHKDGVRDRSLILAKKFMSMGHTAEEAAAFAEIDVNLLEKDK